MVSRLFILLLIALCFALPANAAAWHRAESEHYIVHARLEEAELRALMQTIEEFDRVLNGLMPGETWHGRKPEFTLTGNARRIARVVDFGATAVCENHAEMPVAYALYAPTPAMAGQPDPGEIFYCLTQFHLGNAFFRPKPMWVTAGLSHFFATGFRNKEGIFVIGVPRRLQPVSGITKSALAETLTVRFRHRREEDFARFLDLSRALASPLLFEARFAGVLDRYVGAYAGGRSIEDAASELGDLDALTQELARRRIVAPVRRVQVSPPVRADVAIRPMRADEIALIDLRFERLLETRLKSTAASLRGLTRRHPESALVWYEYAAAEYARVQHSDFGGRPVFRGFGFSNGELIVMANPYSDAEAWRAVKQALALDPDLEPAQRLKAEIMLARLVREGNPDDPGSYREVRALLARQARKPERHPLAAALYHQTYIEQDRTPPGIADRQLERAFLHNAGVGDFRYAQATALSRRGEKDMARGLLISMLNDPAYASAALRALEVTQ
jgi:hypothetical protein